MKIYFAIHGTTIDNETGVASGWSDAELSELGIKQSKEMGETFQNIKIDLICCSDLQRAVETVRLAFGDKLPVIIDPRLRELNYGDLNSGSSKLVGEMKLAAIKTPFPNGESYDQAMVRIQDFYQELKKNHPNETVLVVGHRATHYGLDTLTGQTLEQRLNVPFVWQPYWEYDL